MKKTNLIFATTLSLIMSSVPAVAGTIGLGTWYEFGFDPNHSHVVAGCLPNNPTGVPCRTGTGTTNLDANPWTFTALTSVLFTITDGYLAGDSFDVLDFGTLIGSTPAVATNAHNCGLDPRLCVTDSQISHASLLLGPGAHSITISVRPAQVLGEGFFQVSAVPEPSLSGCLVLRSSVDCLFAGGSALSDGGV